MNKHTPGPWEWFESHDGSVYLATPRLGRLVVMDFVRFGMQKGQPRFATWKGDERGNMGGIMVPAVKLDVPSHPDAKLISAAPDLFDALIECLAIVRVQNGNRHADVNEIMQRAEAAIAKATVQ